MEYGEIPCRRNRTSGHGEAAGQLQGSNVLSKKDERGRSSMMYTTDFLPDH